MKSTLQIFEDHDWERLAERLGMRPTSLEIGPESGKTWGFTDDIARKVTLIGVSDTRRLFLASAPSLRFSDAVRKAAVINRGAELIWVVPERTSGVERVSFYFAKPDQRTRRFEIVCDDPKPSSLARLERMLSCDGSSSEIEQVFDADDLTRAFFKDFKASHARISNGLRSGPSDEREREEIAVTWLLRLVFVYFLQGKRALDGDLSFVSRNLKAFSSGSLHEDFFKPLFFGALNTEVSKRNHSALKLGTIPFLNGGLFEPSRLEKKYPKISLGNDVWKSVVSETFERYQFVGREPGFGDDVCAVDPEMLGKVFESLMMPGARKKSGAFYTPREIVHDIVSQTIDAQLSEMLACDVEVLDRALTSDPRAARKVLRRFRILDPAVGTGAFLLTAVEHLLSKRELLGDDITPQLVRDVITQNVYGVDKNVVAIKICELRFWLRILVSYRNRVSSLPPLPNLSHRFVPGDALVDPIDFHVATSENAQKRSKTLGRLEDVFRLSHGAEKAKALRSLEAARRELQVEALSSAKESVDRKIEAINIIETQTDLLGGVVRLRTQDRKERDDLRAQSNALANRCTAVQNNKTASDFSFTSHFPVVMNEGGFHVVLMNPPWVRQSAVDSDIRQHLSRRYRTARPSLWRTAATQGVRSRFGNQSDLANVFVERALEVTRPSGRVAALVPSKMFRSLHGTSVRGLIDEHTLEHVSEIRSNDIFDATTYPARLQIRKGKLETAAKLPLLFGTDARAPWVLESLRNQNAGPIADLLRELSDRHPPLGQFELLKPTRGLFTGCNEVFVKPAGTFRNLFGRSRFVRPALAGRRQALEILFAYDDKLRPVQSLPKKVRRYFSNHQNRLEARGDFDSSQPVWQVFRVHPRQSQPKVLWKDLDVWFSPSAISGNGVPLNTTYYIPCETEHDAKRVEALLSFCVTRVFLRLLCERARGGWRRHFAWSVQCVPIPEAFFRSDDIPSPQTLAKWYGLDAEQWALLERYDDED